jgi:GntR family transcriptional regulator/MocR family aminotransferase
MKKIYKNRRNFLIHCLKTTFSDKVNILGYSTGLHLIVEFNESHFSKELLEWIEQFGVKVYPVEDHTIENGKHHNRIILGYGHLKNEEIKEGVTRLHQAIYNFKSKKLKPIRP